MASPETLSSPDPTSEALPLNAPSHATSPLSLRDLYHAYMELGKARLSAMVVITTALGFIVASRAYPPPTASTSNAFSGPVSAPSSPPSAPPPSTRPSNPLAMPA